MPTDPIAALGRLARVRVPLLPAVAGAVLLATAALLVGPSVQPSGGPGAGPAAGPGTTADGRSGLLSSLLRPFPAAAAQPYGPVALTLAVRVDGTRELLRVDVSGLRPNSSVEAVSEGRFTSTAVADAAGVAQVDVALPDAIDVQVRGIAADGAPLVLRESVPFPRFGVGGTVVDGVLETSASRPTLLLALTGVTVAVAGFALARAVAVRRGARARTSQGGGRAGAGGQEGRRR